MSLFDYPKFEAAVASLETELFRQKINSVGKPYRADFDAASRRVRLARQHVNFERPMDAMKALWDAQSFIIFGVARRNIMLAKAA